MPPPDRSPALNRRRFLRSTTGPLCCGVAAGLGIFQAPEVVAQPVAPADWPAAVRRLWQETWRGVDPAQVIDMHAHLLGHTAAEPTEAGAWIHPRTTSPLAFGDWVRRISIERASGVAGHRARLSERYVERLAELWAPFPAGAAPSLLAFDAVVLPDGRTDLDRTMFCTGNGYAARIAAERGWGWTASIHPHRPDAIARLEAAQAAGARVVKWLPSAMAINPADPAHRPYYRAMERLGLFLLSHAGEEVAVTGAGEYDWINPLLLRAPLEAGVRVIVAHCASLGEAVDLDAPGQPKARAFDLFVRLMEDAAFGHRVYGDLSAVTQINRRPMVLQRLLERRDWHSRLLWGSDYPLPAIGWLTDAHRLADAGLLDEADVEPLERLQTLNPMAFDFALKRRLRRDKSTFSADVFEARRVLAMPG
jgi:uncharacterized protein